MKLTVKGADLHQAAAWAAKIAPGNPPVPTLAGVLLTAADDLTLAACDYETFGTATVNGAVVREQGRAIVSARLLAEVAKAAEMAEVTVELDGPKLSVRAGRSTWRLPTMELDLWPQFPSAGDSLGTIAGNALADALARVLPAVDPTSERQILRGVLVNFGDQLALVGTDTKRVAELPVDWVSQHQPPGPVVVAHAALRHIADSGEVTISTDSGVIGFSTARLTTLVRLLDGEFPKLGPILDAPARNATAIMVADVQAMRAAIMAASVGLPPGPGGHLRLSIDSEVVTTVKASGDEDGDASGECDVHSLSGEPIELVVRAEYLRDALAALDSKFGRFTFTTPTKAFLAQGCDDQGEPTDAYRHVLMPINPGKRS